MSVQRGGRVGNAADKEQVRKARRSERNDRVDRDHRLQFVMSTETGRRFMWDDVLSRFGTFESVWDASNNQTFFNIGRQDLGHEWMGDVMRVCPNEYLLMQTEALRRRQLIEADVDTPPVESDTDA